MSPIGDSPSRPDIPKPKPTIFPPTPTGRDASQSAEDIKARQRRARGRRATRLTTPGMLSISDVNIMRPELKDKFG